VLQPENGATNGCETEEEESSDQVVTSNNTELSEEVQSVDHLSNAEPDLQVSTSCQPETCPSDTKVSEISDSDTVEQAYEEQTIPNCKVIDDETDPPTTINDSTTSSEGCTSGGKVSKKNKQRRKSTTLPVVSTSVRRKSYISSGVGNRKLEDIQSSLQSINILMVKMAKELNEVDRKMCQQYEDNNSRISKVEESQRHEPGT
jgi:hypothetical protein